MGTISEDIKGRALSQAAENHAVLAIGNDRFDDPAIIDDIIALVPAQASSLFDLRVVVTECIANVVMHGSCRALIVSIKTGTQSLILQFTHIPPLPDIVREEIARARAASLPDFNDPFYLGTGLGYPLMTRLCRHIQLSPDNACLELTFPATAEL